MTVSEVNQILPAQRVVMQRVILGPCLADYLAMHNPIVPPGGPGHCTHVEFATFAGGSLLVFFNEALPARPGVSVVTTIAVNDATGDELSSVMKQAGAPTLTDGPVSIWCFDYPCKTGNDWNKPYTGRQLLIHQGSGLTLVDNKAEHAYEQSLVEQLKAQGVRIQA